MGFGQGEDRLKCGFERGRERDDFVDIADSVECIVGDGIVHNMKRVAPCWTRVCCFSPASAKSADIS
jgi:hypothetical protein